ncbi:unnamed protein product [Rhodiola kirilowii]
MASSSAGGRSPMKNKSPDPFDFRPLFASAAASSHRGAIDDRASATTDFSFAFNVSNFSDRVLRIEIVEESAVRNIGVEGGGTRAECDGKRKRRREDDKVENDDYVWVEQEEQFLNREDPEEEEAYGDHDGDILELAEEPCLDKAVLSISKDCCNACATWNGKRPAIRVNNIHISSPILAAKSPFFFKLFSNGMKETEQKHVTLRIKAHEEEAFMNLLHFMYSSTLWSSTEHELMDVLLIADKFEVASCMRYCSQILGKTQMSLDSALLYLDLHSNVLMADAVQPLTEAAKQFLSSHYNDITKFGQEVLDLPLAGFEAVLSNDDLHVSSEDAVYDLVLKYVRTRYPSMEERRKVLGTRLSRLIRFPFMTCRKLRKVLTCTDFDPEPISKVVMDALFFKAETPHRQRSLAAADTANRHFAERAYKYRPVKIMEFEFPQPQCVVYLDLKREECANLFPIGRIYSQAFHLSGQGFFLSAHCNMDQENAFHCFGLFLGMQEKGSKTCSVDYKFSTRMKPKEDFEVRYTGTYTFTGGKAVGYRNLLSLPWVDFLAADSKYFINEVLHLKAELKIKPPTPVD